MRFSLLLRETIRQLKPFTDDGVVKHTYHKHHKLTGVYCGRSWVYVMPSSPSSRWLSLTYPATLKRLKRHLSNGSAPYYREERPSSYNDNNNGD